MVLSLFLSVSVWSILLILRISFDTLVYPFSRKATCLEITNLFLTVPYTHMPSYISIILKYPFIESGRLFNIIWLPTNMSIGDTTQMI